MNAAMAGETAEPAPTFRKRCGICSRSFTADMWNGLPIVATVPAASVQAHLTVSASWAIELRTCACGVVLAARR